LHQSKTEELQVRTVFLLGYSEKCERTQLKTPEGSSETLIGV